MTFTVELFPLSLVAFMLALLAMYSLAMAWHLGWKGAQASKARVVGLLREQIEIRDREISSLQDTNRMLAELRRQKESSEMARKPLTAEQLASSIAGEVLACPRCGSECLTEIEITDSQTAMVQDIECDDCQERFKVRFNAVSVEAAE